MMRLHDLANASDQRAYDFYLDSDSNSDTMASVDTLVAALRKNPKTVRYSDLCRVCDHFFGEPRQQGSSHRVYKTPWQGDPRVNIQNDRGKAKAYQVRQVLAAIDRLAEIKDDGE